jgi:hypothetical protein
MSQLHRNIFAQIMAGLEPVVETAVTAFVPEGAIIAPLLEAGASAAETALDGNAAPAVVSVLPPDHVSPLPAPAPAAAAQPAPAPAPSGQTGAATAAAAAPLSAQDVINALLQTLRALQARA